AMKQVAGRVKLDLAQFRELAAFAQFGSDLDAATQAKIERGKRIVEVFKQPQYNPIPVEAQAAVLWAAQNGYFDDIAVEKIKDCQNKLTEYLTTRKSGLTTKLAMEKGLCGPLNSNLLREAARFDKATTLYITAGRKASQFIARTKRQLAAEFTYKDAPLFSEARAISRFAQDLFIRGAVDAVDILFTNFISTLAQKP